MRTHLAECFRKKQLEPFPFPAPHVKSPDPSYNIHVYYDCELPEVYDNMIQCDHCDKWFHFCCAGDKAPATLAQKWFCNTCYLSCHCNLPFFAIIMHSQGGLKVTEGAPYFRYIGAWGPQIYCKIRALGPHLMGALILYDTGLSA